MKPDFYSVAFVLEEGNHPFLDQSLRDLRKKLSEHEIDMAKRIYLHVLPPFMASESEMLSFSFGIRMAHSIQKPEGHRVLFAGYKTGPTFFKGDLCDFLFMEFSLPETLQKLLNEWHNEIVKKWAQIWLTNSCTSKPHVVLAEGKNLQEQILGFGKIDWFNEMMQFNFPLETLDVLRFDYRQNNWIPVRD